MISVLYVALGVTAYLLIGGTFVAVASAAGIDFEANMTVSEPTAALAWPLVLFLLALFGLGMGVFLAAGLATRIPRAVVVAITARVRRWLGRVKVPRASVVQR